MSETRSIKGIGYLEGFHPSDKSVIYGWAGDGKIPSKRVDLDVLLDGVTVARIQCDQERKDLVNEKGRFGYAFMFRIPSTQIHGRQQQLSVRFAASSQELTQSPIRFGPATAATEGIEEDANHNTPIKHLPLTTLQCTGYLDGFGPADSMTIHGWASDMMHPANMLILELRLDGKTEEFIQCDCLRKDLVNQAGEPQGFGFFYQLPARMFDGKAHEIDVRIANTTISLQHSPLRKVLSGNPQLVPHHDELPATAICAILKNELPYLLEWIAFHKVVGFSDFVLYDNMSNDGSHAVLTALQEAGEITFFSWPDAIGPNRQIMAYNHYLQHFRSRHDWTLFLDLDEFFVPVQEQTVHSLLNVSEETAAIAINWMIFGSTGAGIRSEGLVIERFVRRAPEDFQQNYPFKSLCRTALIDRPGIHAPKPWRGSTRNLKQEKVGVFGFDWSHLQNSHEKFRIHHYFVKSLQEWELKKKRGRPDADIGSKFSRRSDYEFRIYDRNEILDESALRFLEATKTEMARLSSLPGIAEALAAAGVTV